MTGLDGKLQNLSSLADARLRALNAVSAKAGAAERVAAAEPGPQAARDRELAATQRKQTTTTAPT